MLRNYVKIAFRNLMKYKLNSSINIFGMAIGLAVCFLILMFVQDELSYDQYHKNKDRVYRLLNNNSLWHSPNEAKVLKSNFPEIEEAVRILPRDGFQVQYGEKKFIEDKVTYADESFFKLFTFEFLQGNEKTALDKRGSVVITEEIAKKYFENENPIGKILRVKDDDDYIVSAVVKKMPHNTHIHFNIFFSIVDDETLFGDWATNWGWRNFPTYVMLRENATTSQLGEKLTGLVLEVNPQRPEAKAPDYSFIKITDIHLFPAEVNNPLEAQSDITYVIIFSSIAIFILLIACFNYVNILTANSTTRLKEVGIKKVIGATRKQLTRQFFLEAVLQFSIAFIMALVIVLVSISSFNDFTSKELSFSNLFSYQAMMSVFSIIVLTVVIAGGYPARMISKFQPAIIMKGMKTTSNSSFNLRRVLVVLQYSISIALIISATVMLRQIDFINTTDLGYDKELTVICEYVNDSENPKYPSLKNALLQNSNISMVSAGARLPSTDLGNVTYLKVPGADEGHLIGIVHTDYDYFETFGIKPKLGRLFSEAMKTDSEESIILNESAVRELGLGDEPLDKTMSEAWSDGNVRVIGVVPDFHFESLYTEIAPAVFVIGLNHCRQIVAKIKPNDIPATLEFIEGTWKSFYPDRVYQHKFLDENYAALYESDQRTFKLMSYFTILAVFIASLGLFGMITHSARSRVKEIGVRKVLGASVLTIIRILTSEYLKWIAFAFILAAPLAYYMLDAWLQNFAYRINISSFDFLFAGIIIVVISFLTVIWQGVKASTANPVESLKYE